MTDVKNHRQRALADLIRTKALSSQDELAQQLADLGYAVTQATISRDLEQLGAVKVRRGGHLGYALGGHPSEERGPRLAAVLRDWVRSIDTATNLVVIKTPPGSAHLVGVVLDQSDMPEIVGNICGDDTLFIACRGSADADMLAEKLAAAGGLGQRRRGE